MITTTLNEIKSFGPCEDVWETLLKHLGKTEADNEEFPLATVLDRTGLDDTVWCLRVCPDVAAVFVDWCAARTVRARDYYADAAAEAAARAAANADGAAAAAEWCADRAARAAADARVSGAAADYNKERQAQTEKLRELLS